MFLQVKALCQFVVFRASTPIQLKQLFDEKKLNFQLNANGEAKTYLPLSIESERT